MCFLEKVAVTAKTAGSITLDWGTLRRGLSREGGLEFVPGRSEIEKLQSWAEELDLLMDYDVELQSFTSEVRTVTFSSPRAV